MAPSTKSKSSGSMTFTIAIVVVVLVMVGIIFATIFSGKQDKKSESKIEFSEVATVAASTVDGKIGENSVAVLPDSGADPEVGKIVPTITGLNFSGKEVTIAPTGKPYVLAFIAHWCVHCQKEVPKIVALHEGNELPDDVEFIAIATATDSNKVNYPPSEWLFDEDWPWEKIADDKNATIANAFGLGGYPYVVYVNADGTIASRTSGEKEDADIIAAAKAISKKDK